MDTTTRILLVQCVLAVVPILAAYSIAAPSLAFALWLTNQIEGRAAAAALLSALMVFVLAVLGFLAVTAGGWAGGWP